MMRNFSLLIVLIVAVAGPGSLFAFQASTEKPVPEKLLRLYWENNKDNRNSASVLWGAIERGPATDIPSLFAFVANQVEHNNTRRAREAARLLTRLAPEDPKAWEVRIWLETIMDSFDDAAANLRNAGKALKADKSLSDVEKQRISGRLGRIIGFLEGPVKDFVGQDLLKQSVEELEASLTPAEKEKLIENRELALKTFRDLVAKNETKIEAEKERIQKQNVVELANLEKQEQDLQQQLSQIGPQLQAVQMEGARQISLAEQAIAPAVSNLGQVNSQINRDQLTLGVLTNDLIYYQNNFPNSLNVGLILNSMRTVRFNLNNLYNQARGLENEIAVAQNRVARLRFSFNQQANALQNQKRALERKKSRNLKRQGEIAKGPKVALGKLSSFDAREKSINTYLDYPLEFLRRDLLRKHVD